MTHTVSIVGGSGYAGGELLRILTFHPEVDIKQATSERYAGRSVYKVHPNLRDVNDLKFSSIDDLEECDTLFLCLPHGHAMEKIRHFKELADNIIDLSADFRLNDEEVYEEWYGSPHASPEMLSDFLYGIPELHRVEMAGSSFVSSAGCNATATILALYPLYEKGWVDEDRTVVEVKTGSSEGGNKPSLGSHHPERSGCVRSYSPTKHRHTAEIVQELGSEVNFSATSIDMVRGILATCHVFLTEEVEEKDIWQAYLEAYGDEPFIRIVNEKRGIYRYPEPKIVEGTNYCDVGFELDPDNDRLVVISAIDNLVKGAAGQAVQAFNVMNGFEETVGLEFPGLHP